jgi:hypothetical protein
VSINKALGNELIGLANFDQEVRARLAETGELFSHGYHPEMKAVHIRNASRLKEIIETYGWPGRDIAGEEGSRAAWLILQHSIGDPEFQRRGLDLVRGAAGRGDADALEVAMLDDRIRVFEGRPQRYGTQFDWDAHGEMSPYPIEDIEHIDDRRREVGLEPLAERIASMRAAIANAFEGPPPDYAARQRQFEAWAREVGWRK